MKKQVCITFAKGTPLEFDFNSRKRRLEEHNPVRVGGEKIEVGSWNLEARSWRLEVGGKRQSL